MHEQEVIKAIMEFLNRVPIQGHQERSAMNEVEAYLMRRFDNLNTKPATKPKVSGKPAATRKTKANASD